MKISKLLLLCALPVIYGAESHEPLDADPGLVYQETQANFMRNNSELVSDGDSDPEEAKEYAAKALELMKKREAAPLSPRAPAAPIAKTPPLPAWPKKTD